MVLELVVRQLLDLGVVPLRDELEVGRSVLVPREADPVDGPAHGPTAVERGEGMAEPDLVPTPAEAAERAGLLDAVRVAEHQPVAGRPRGCALPVGRVHEPAPPADDDHVALAELVVGHVRDGVLVSGARANDQLVAKLGGHAELQ